MLPANLRPARRQLPASLPGVWLATLLFGAFAACGGETGETGSEARSRPGSAKALADPGEVVARVNGVPLLLVDLERQMHDGTDARRALRALVHEELLAQEAARRGLARAPSVRRAERRALASLLLRRGFGDTFTAADIPKDMVLAAYKRNRKLFDRPELAHVVHVLAPAGKRDPPAVHRQAEQLARRLRQTVTGRISSPEGFEAKAAALGAAGGRGATAAGASGSPPVELRTGRLTTPRSGYTVEPFAAAAFALSRPGQISPVVQTEYGYHVIYLIERTPAHHVPFERAEAEVRERLFDEVRRSRFLEWMTELERRHRVQTLAPAKAGALGERASGGDAGSSGGS